MTDKKLTWTNLDWATATVEDVKKIMELFSISERMARKYAAANRMIPELQEALKNGIINITESEKFATFSEDAQYQILELIKGNGKVDKSELEALKKIEEEKQELAGKIEDVQKDLKERDQRIATLEKMIKQLQTEKKDTPSPKIAEEDPQEEIAKLKELLDKTLTEKKKTETKLENLKIQEDKKNERGFKVSQEELKKVANVAKAEALCNNLYSLMKEAEKLRQTICTDAELKAQFSIVSERMQKLLTEE